METDSEPISEKFNARLQSRSWPDCSRNLCRLPKSGSLLERLKDFKFFTEGLHSVLPIRRSGRMPEELQMVSRSGRIIRWDGAPHWDQCVAAIHINRMKWKFSIGTFQFGRCPLVSTDSTDGLAKTIRVCTNDGGAVCQQIAFLTRLGPSRHRTGLLGPSWFRWTRFLRTKLAPILYFAKIKSRL